MSLPLLSAALLAFSGMLGLCLGLERHYKQLLNARPNAVLLKTLRALGWLALAASFAACVTAWGWAMGPVGWFGMLSLAGLATAFWSTYAIRTLIAMAGVGWLVLGILALIR